MPLMPPDDYAPTYLEDLIKAFPARREPSKFFFYFKNIKLEKANFAELGGRETRGGQLTLPSWLL